MLDISLEAASYSYPRWMFHLSISAEFPSGTHTAIVGPAGAGKTTLLKLISGELGAATGRIRLGTRDATGLSASALPVLAYPRDLRFPGRWSTEHALVAAVRRRSLDREDRRREVELAVEKWQLENLLQRRLGTLSSSEGLRVILATVELRKPAVFIAERLFESAAVADAPALIEELYRTLRAIGTTVITEISRPLELAFCDRVLVLEAGWPAQQGTPKEIYDRPASAGTAISTGQATFLPVQIRGNEVESPIGRWNVSNPGFEGEGFAVVRPTDFSVATAGQESDLILGVEEAGFSEGMWHIRGYLTGGLSLRISLPPDQPLHKGRLLPLSYDPSRFRIFPAAVHPLQPRPKVD